MYKKIKLTNNKYALVDIEDYEKINKHKWCAIKNGHSWYAIKTKKKESNSCGYTVEYMHRLIMNDPIEPIDHKNHNGIDNRKQNLRIAGHKGNQRNRQFIKNSTGYKGVKQTTKYSFMARICMEGVHTYLGSYNCPEKAALVYDATARYLFKEFACCNFNDQKHKIELPKKIKEKLNKKYNIN